MGELTAADRALIEKATAAIRDRYRPGVERTSRSVGAALRTDSGEVYTGVNLTAATPRASVCAEPIAVGAAVTAGDLDFGTIVSVKYSPETSLRASESMTEEDEEAVVISPCGVCRELIRDYDPTTEVIVDGDDGLLKLQIVDLLPDLRWRGAGPPDSA